MRKAFIIIGFVLIVASLLLFTGCKPKLVVNETEPLFNETANEEIENLTSPEKTPADDCQGFLFEWEPRNESKYEIAEDDIFTSTMGNFTSDEISFFGVMLGDSLEQVVDRLGIPDVMYIPADESYKNMEYRKRIGLCSLESGLTFHLVNDTVTRITVKPNFAKYMHGNTSVGTDKEVVYTLLDVPDYQDFVYVYRIFHYVGKGVEVYFKNRYINRMSFIPSKEFKGVVYQRTPFLASEGIIVNATKAIPVE